MENHLSLTLPIEEISDAQTSKTYEEKVEEVEG